MIYVYICKVDLDVKQEMKLTGTCAFNGLLSSIPLNREKSQKVEWAANVIQMFALHNII